MNKVTANNLSTTVPIVTILIVWIMSLILLGFFQGLGYHFGFNVWPMGEDRNFLGFMLQAKGAKVAHEFWNMNDRNPMSIWWWILVSPIIKSFDCGLYIIRKCLDPFLAIAVFLLLDRLGRQQCRTFAFSVALLVLTWNFSSYFEQVIWVYLGALGTSLLTIYFYCRYVDSNRRNSRDLAIALILYLFTITTYTLQPGAIIAITFLAFFRVSNQAIKLTRWERVCHPAWDVGFFAGIFLIYNMIWYTVSRNADVFYVFNWSMFSKQFLQSIQHFFYHPAYHALLKLTFADFSLLQIISIFFSAFLFSCFLFFIYPAKKILDSVQNIPLGWVVVIMLSIIVPIIILESTSSIWYPGSRSLMVQQVWQPLLYVSVIFLIVNLLPWCNSSAKHKTVLVLIALLNACSFVMGLDYNHHLVLRTHYQQTLAEGIKKLNISPAESPFYLVRVARGNDADINTIRVYISIYGQTMLHQPVSLRVISNIPNPAHAPYWRTRFEKDTKGVMNAGPIGDKHPVPYSKLWIIFFDGQKVWVPKVVHKEDFEGLQVDWERATSIDQHDKANQIKFRKS
ncbi:MAG: hypothetical protein ABI597_03780 [Gammaproteobacteria bacterium]